MTAHAEIEAQNMRLAPNARSFVPLSNQLEAGRKHDALMSEKGVKSWKVDSIGLCVNLLITPDLLRLKRHSPFLLNGLFLV